jgi:hypothetical protein
MGARLNIQSLAKHTFRPPQLARLRLFVGKLEFRYFALPAGPARSRSPALYVRQKARQACPAIIAAALSLPEKNAAAAEMTINPHAPKANRGRNSRFFTGLNPGHRLATTISNACYRLFAGILPCDILSLYYKPTQPMGWGATAVTVLLSASVVKLTRSRQAYGSRLWRSRVHVTSGAEVRSSHENPALTNFSMAETKGMPGETSRATSA